MNIFKGIKNWWSRRQSIKNVRAKVKDAKTAGLIDDNGLTGNSGMIPGLGHINAPYSAGPDNVFIYSDDAPMEWKRAPLKQAEENRIIRCRFCSKAAVILDHHYPYHKDRNACDEHRDAYDRVGPEI